MTCLRTILLGFLLVAPVRSLVAQTPAATRDDLLRWVPADFGLCVSVTDLRGHAERWEKNPWTAKLKQSPLVKLIFDSPEFRELDRFQRDLQKHVGIEWSALRDEVLGDAVVFAFHPGPEDKIESEQGLFLLHARKPAVLRELLDRVNKIQMQQGELRALQDKQHSGATYVGRDTSRGSQFYFLDGAFFAFSGEEKLIQALIDARKRGPAVASPISEHLRRAGADKSLVSLWVNPRLFASDLQRKAASPNPGEQAVMKMLLDAWRSLDAIVVSVTAEQAVELRLSLQAGPGELPTAMKRMFHEPSVASEAWRRFPENAIFAVAGRIDFVAIVESVKGFVPAESRAAIAGAIRPLTDLTGLDLMDKVLPNLGPDWGLCVVADADATRMPQVLAALAVRPGSGEAPVDQTIYQGLNVFAALAVLDHNRKNPHPIRLRTLRQDAVEVKSLVGDKVFPPGVEPAYALKGGYLIFASSPEAIKRFGSEPRSESPSGDALLARLSAIEFAKLARAHRSAFIGHIAAKNQLTPEAAAQELEQVLAVLDLIDRVDITHSSGNGQAAYSLRIRLAE